MPARRSSGWATSSKPTSRDALEATQFDLSLQRLKPGTRTPFGHRHGQQEEAYVIVEGGGRLKFEDEIVEVARWDAVRVAPEAARAFQAGAAASR